MPEQATASKPDADRVLWRVVLPKESDPLDVRPLYLDEPDNVNCHVTSRRQVQVPPSARVSFASYFNAFPASYWKRWTTVEQVTLHLKVRGAGRIEIYRSKPNGDLVHLQGTPVHAEDDWQTFEFEVSLAPFEDGGWLWFDVFTENTPLEIDDACWLSDKPLRQQKMAIGTTTFSRLDDCVAALLSLGEDQAVLDVVAKIYVADQGPKKVRDHARYGELVSVLGDRLEVIEQGNLGGAGGFTRAFYETLEHTSPGTVDQIMLMDDDIAIETDSILRSNMFARAAAKPVIVGSQMLNLQAKSRLHTMGEVVDLATCVWRAAPGAKVDHDFGQHSLRESPELHKRIDATYNGWWMCLFPREVVEKTGLPLPLFIKCDDAEFSLRASSLDMPTVTLPGSAVWHEPWTDKNDTKDWTVYFHLRNRLVMAALHSPYDLRKTLLLQGARVAVRRLFSMEYSTAALENKALEDFMAGPERLFELDEDRVAGGPEAAQAVHGRTVRAVRSGVPAAVVRHGEGRADAAPAGATRRNRDAGGEGVGAQPAFAGSERGRAAAGQHLGQQRAVVPARQPRLRDRVERGWQRGGLPPARPEGVPGVGDPHGTQLPAVDRRVAEAG